MTERADQSSDRHDDDAPCDAPSEPPGRTDVVKVRSLVGLGLWALVVFVAFRYWAATQFVVLGVLAAAALAAVLRPLADRLPGRTELRAAAAVALFVVCIGGVLFLVGWALYDPIRTNIERWPELKGRANAGLQDAARRVGTDAELTVDRLGEIGLRILAGGAPEQWISDFAGSVLTALLSILVVVIAAVYLLARPTGSLSEPAVQLLPRERQEASRQALEQLQPQLRWWVLGTAFSMTVVGVVSGLGYWAIGLEFALALALFAAVSQAVPTFGPMVTLLLSLMVAGTQGTPQLVGVVVVYLVVQTLESYVLTPMVMMRVVHVPPVITLVTVIFWGNVFGLAGLLLAIPLDLVVWAFLKHHLVETHRLRAEAASDG